MDTDWKHQKDAITTDQKNLTDDEHIHELDKAHLKQSKAPEVTRPGANKSRKGKSGRG
jgi:hypothetical protein